MHLVHPPPPQIFHNRCFQFLLGIIVIRRENEDDGYVKFWGAKQGALWSMWKWWILGSRLPYIILRTHMLNLGILSPREPTVVRPPLRLFRVTWNTTIHPSIQPSIIHPSIHPSIYLSIDRSIYQFVNVFCTLWDKIKMLLLKAFLLTYIMNFAPLTYFMTWLLKKMQFYKNRYSSYMDIYMKL